MFGFWVKVAACAAIAVALWYGYHTWTESLRAEGRLEVQLAWDEAIEAQKVLEAKIAEETRTRLVAQEAERAKAYAALRNRNKALEARLAAVSVDAALLAGMRDSVRTANSSSPGGTTPDTAPAAGAADGIAVNNWFADVTELYRKCRDQVIAWVEWDNGRVKQ